jgi:hypothetical protein
MSNVITREYNDPWACYIRACAKVASCEIDSKEEIAAKKYALACFKAYQFSATFMLPKQGGSR